MTSRRDGVPSLVEEAMRVQARRRALGYDVEADAPVFGLALSGGGIRSATFALGVMQALNEVPVPVPQTQGVRQSKPPERTRDPARLASGAHGADSRLSNLLARFDYLSTVSGGGYVGSFFCSLFVPGRVTGHTRLHRYQASRDAARLAYRVMANEPPSRMRIEAETSGERLDRQPLAWLRENARYLAPTGAGDMIYAGALAIRNWLAIQYVLATVIVATLALIMLGRAWAVLEFRAWQVPSSLAWVSALSSSIASGFIWGIGIAIVLLWSFPAGIAFWLAHSSRGQSDGDVQTRVSLAAWGDFALGSTLVTALVASSGDIDRYRSFVYFFLGIGIQALLGFVFYLATWYRRSVTFHRVLLTRQLATSLKIATIVFVIAAADWLALVVYNDGFQGQGPGNALKGTLAASLLPAAIWAIRHMSVLFDQKSGANWWRKLPIDWVAAIAAIVIGLSLIVGWAVLIDWMLWNGGMAYPDALDDTSRRLLSWISVVSIVMALVVGQFPAFINLSSLQAIYSARLTRAYLGASNSQRLQARMHSDGVKSEPGGSVAEPLPSDQLTHEDYYDCDVLAPLHIINVTVNQTTDSNEQLVQRDRKGLPLAILPRGFTIDGNGYRFRPDASGSEIARTPTIGQWIGTSGAAVATGLGRTTTRGLSLLLGLANVRLGVWWQSQPWSRRKTIDDLKERGIGWVIEHAFATQYYLLCELTAQFHGLRRRWQYLSDGGHFDNTGIYELLRPERRLGLIVACDNGADVEGRFNDLANLIRVARIDFGLELKINQQICDEPWLGRIFGRPNDLVGHVASKKCAMLIDVFFTDPNTRERKRTCRIVVLKPRVIGGAPLDILQYAAAHPTFPNESTAQQFFDEAQWESYRKLGVTIGRTVFGLGDKASPATEDALWRFLALDGPKTVAT